MKSTPSSYKRAAAPKPKFARGTRASFQSCIDPNINGTGLVVEAKYFPKDGSMEVLSPQQVLVVKFHGKAPGRSVPSFRVGALGDALDTTN